MKVLITLCLLIFCSGSVLAQTIQSVANGPFDDASNWDLGRVPQSGDSAIIHHTITETGDLLLDGSLQLVVKSTGILCVAGNLDVPCNTTIYNKGVCYSAEVNCSGHIRSWGEMYTQVQMTILGNACATSGSFIQHDGFTQIGLSSTPLCANNNDFQPLEQLATGIEMTAPNESKSLWLYPNPAMGVQHLTVRTTVDSRANIRYIDVTGRVVYHVDQEIGAGEHDLPVTLSSELNEGMYLVRVEVVGTKSHEHFSNTWKVQLIK